MIASEEDEFGEDDEDVIEMDLPGEDDEDVIEMDGPPAEVLDAWDTDEVAQAILGNFQDENDTEIAGKPLLTFRDVAKLLEVLGLEREDFVQMFTEGDDDEDDEDMEMEDDEEEMDPRGRPSGGGGRPPPGGREMRSGGGGGGGGRDFEQYDRGYSGGAEGGRP
eukprot:CAMPEP_0115127918 /NCGR_PEP_ID=MMETSP0227-20121206/50748_1 /TAXON_ID=89957 /ORGANISM="Polarella glacialis, Strain CCMP 1383" /LENGTH=163 /DNA_ID=CAMNT_0002532221 /DNA_START=1 /DNA_END=489 /DNA_ORIENTATION=+